MLADEADQAMRRGDVGPHRVRGAPPVVREMVAPPGGKLARRMLA
jgi:hypothetical protein